jgi:hypothetical protein
MDGNNAISMDKSEKERRDEAWGTTHSATGAFIALRDEGSKVVGAVSSEKAIPYLAKIPRGRTKVPRAAAKSNARHGGSSGCAGGWLAGWRYSDFKEEDRFDGSTVDAGPCPRYSIVAAFVTLEPHNSQPTTLSKSRGTSLSARHVERATDASLSRHRKSLSKGED